jgi:hypothetical protein
VNAHHAPDLFDGGEGLSYRYWQWRITPKQTHLIEGVFHNASTALDQKWLSSPQSPVNSRRKE